MQVSIRDRAALESLSVLSVRAYLESRGWINDGPWGRGRASLYLKEHEGRSRDVIVPNLDTAADYALRMSEAIATLAEVEQQSQLEVYYDVVSAGGDLVRLRSRNGKSAGSLSLRQSADMFNDAYTMLAAAARAAEKPQAVYRGSMSGNVSKYLDNVQPLPNYFDGYALALHSPVAAGIGEQQDFGDDFHTPFSRRATSQLGKALESATSAVSEAIANDTLEPFERAVSAGVSANLCTAVAELAEKGRGIDISLLWSNARPANVPSLNFPFTVNSSDILKEAAASFQRNEPFLDERLIAHIVKLEREPHEFDGRAVMSYVREGHPLRLSVQFEQADFDTVIRAFHDRHQVSVDGDIYRAGAGYELRRPHNLALITDGSVEP